MLPRTAEFIFKEKKRFETKGKTFQVAVSSIEIYRDELKDLLHPDKEVTIGVNADKMTVIKGQTWNEVKDEKDFLLAIHKAS